MMMMSYNLIPVYTLFVLTNCSNFFRIGIVLLSILSAMLIFRKDSECQEMKNPDGSCFDNAGNNEPLCFLASRHMLCDDLGPSQPTVMNRKKEMSLTFAAAKA